MKKKGQIFICFDEHDMVAVTASVCGGARPSGLSWSVSDCVALKEGGCCISHDPPFTLQYVLDTTTPNVFYLLHPAFYLLSVMVQVFKKNTQRRGASTPSSKYEAKLQ